MLAPCHAPSPARGSVRLPADAFITSLQGDLSFEPDVGVVLWSSLTRGSVGWSDHDGLEGAVDLVVEVLSDSSRRRDCEILPPLLRRAGVDEYWIVDAMGETPNLQIHALAIDRFIVTADDGWTYSPLLNRQFRLERSKTPVGWHFDLTFSDGPPIGKAHLMRGHLG